MQDSNFFLSILLDGSFIEGYASTGASLILLINCLLGRQPFGRWHTQWRWCSTWLWATGRRWWVGDLAASESGALPPIRRRRRSCPPPPAPSRHRWQRPGEPLCLVALCPPPSDPKLGRALLRHSATHIHLKSLS